MRAGGPADFVSDRWHEFSNPVSAQVADTPGRFAQRELEQPLALVAGSVERVRRQPDRRNRRGHVRAHRPARARQPLAVLEPHSAPLQDLTETGIVGFLLIATALVAAVLGILAPRAHGRNDGAADRRRGCACSTPVDIDWDYVAVQGPLFLTVGAFVALPPRPLRRTVAAARPRVGVCALAALYSFASPWLADRSLDAAYDAVGRLAISERRADEARAAHSFNPLAVEPLWVLGR